MVAYTLSYVDRTLITLLVRPIRADLGLSDTDFSLLQGLAFAVLYSLLGLPCGWLADRLDRPRLIAAGIALWSVMTALCGLASSFRSLFAARVGVGIGEATLGPAAYSLIADLFPPTGRGRALGAYSMGVYLGAGLAILIGGMLIGKISEAVATGTLAMGNLRPWQATFLLVGVPGVAVAVWVLTLPEPRRVARPGADGPRTYDLSPNMADVGAFLRDHRAFLVYHFVGVGLLTMLFNGVSAWVPALLERRFGFSPVQVAHGYGPLLLLGGSLGIASGGALADFWRRRWLADAEMRCVLVSALLVPLFGILAPLAPTPEVFFAALLPFLYFSSFAFGAAIAALQLATPPALRGRIAALYLLVVNLTGVGFGGTAVALVTDHVFHDDQRVGMAMALVAAVIAPFAILLLEQARRAYMRLDPADASPTNN